MKTVYVASPYTHGDAALNVRAQIEAAENLVGIGYLPYVPLLDRLWHLMSPHGYEYWASMSLAWLELCDAVLRLPGESAGADAEVARALELGMPVYYSIGELQRANNVES